MWECNRPSYEGVDKESEINKSETPHTSEHGASEGILMQSTHHRNSVLSLSLLRYLFYYERYFNHKESKRVAGKQLAATEEKMSKLVSEGMHFMQGESAHGQHVSSEKETRAHSADSFSSVCPARVSVEFLKSATQLVLQCRRVLSWSYAHAFYISDKGVKTLFEFRQSELEQVSGGKAQQRARSKACAVVTLAHSSAL